MLPTQLLLMVAFAVDSNMAEAVREEEKVYQVSTYTLAEKIQFVSKKNYSFTKNNEIRFKMKRWFKC